MAGGSGRRKRTDQKSEPGERRSRQNRRRTPLSTATAAPGSSQLLSTPPPPSSSSSQQPINLTSTSSAIVAAGNLNGIPLGLPPHPNSNQYFPCCPNNSNLPTYHQFHENHHLLPPSNTVHHFGVAQQRPPPPPNIPAVGGSSRSLPEFSKDGESEIHKKHRKHRGEEVVERSNTLELGSRKQHQNQQQHTTTQPQLHLPPPPLPPVNGYNIFPPPPPLHNRGKFFGTGCDSRQQQQPAHQFQFHHPAVHPYQWFPAPEQVQNGYQTVNVSNLTGINHVGSDSNNISLNYVLNENSPHHVPAKANQVDPSPASKYNNIEGQQYFPHKRASAQPRPFIPEISISAINLNSKNHSPKHGMSFPSPSKALSIRHHYNPNPLNQLRESSGGPNVTTSSYDTSGPSTASQPINLNSRTAAILPPVYPCGPEVLHSLHHPQQQQHHSAHNNITCEPLQLNPNGFKSSGSPEITVIVTQPEVTVTRTNKPIVDENVDLSKLNYLSRLACEVGKLEVGSDTRQQLVKEILTNDSNLMIFPLIPKEERDRQVSETDSSDSAPAIIVTAINGRPISSDPTTTNTNHHVKHMGVYHPMANGNESMVGGGGTGLRIKQETVDHHQQHHPREESGNEVLDLRKPLSANSGKLCIWCGKNSTLVENGVASDFCTELCFHMYRRDSFKKRSNCIWCSGTFLGKHFGGVVDESRFCSEECLNNYKVKLFCEETSAHLDQLKDYQINGVDPATNSTSIRRIMASQGPSNNESPPRGGPPTPPPELITPELWLKKQGNRRGKNKQQGPSSATHGDGRPPNTVAQLKTSPDMEISYHHSTSSTTSPSADSPHSQHSAANSLSPNQQLSIMNHHQQQQQQQHQRPSYGPDLAIHEQSSQQQRVQQLPLKGRLHPGYNANSNAAKAAEREGRRRAMSPSVMVDQYGDRGMQFGAQRGSRGGHQNNNSNNFGNAAPQPVPRKRSRGNSNSIATNANVNSANNAANNVHNNFVPMEFAPHPHHLTMLQMAAISAMQGINFNSAGAPLVAPYIQHHAHPPHALPPPPIGGHGHQEHKPSRNKNKNMLMNSTGGGMMNAHGNNNTHLPPGLSEINANSEIARALMGQHQHNMSPHIIHHGPRHLPPPSSMVMQQQGHGPGATGALMTHSGLHAGGLMMFSPTQKQGCSGNSSISNLHLSSLGLSPGSLMGLTSPPHPQQQPTQAPLLGQENGDINIHHAATTANSAGNDNLPIIPPEEIRNPNNNGAGVCNNSPNNNVHLNALAHASQHDIGEGSSGGEDCLPLVMKSGHQQAERQGMTSTSSSPASTCTTCTQTDPDEVKKEDAENENQEGSSNGRKKKKKPKVKASRGSSSNNSGSGNEFSVYPFLPPVTLLIPYPVPIPVPVPLPFFLPSSSFNSVKTEQQILQQPSNEEEQVAANVIPNLGENNANNDESPPPPAPPAANEEGNNEAPGEEENVCNEELSDADLHDQEIKTAIELSLQEVAMEVEIVPEEMAELEIGDQLGDEDLGDQLERVEMGGEERDEIFLECQDEMMMNTTDNNNQETEEDNKSVIGDEREEEIIRGEVEMVDAQDNENSENSPPANDFNFNGNADNDSENPNLGIHPQISPAGGDEAMKMDSSQQPMDN